MCPRLPVNNQANACGGNSELDGDLLHREFFCGVCRSYVGDVGLIKLGLRKTFAPCCSWLKNSSAKRLIDSIFNRPSSIDSIPEDEVTDSRLFRQTHHGHFFSTILNDVITTSIVGLRFIGRPLAIFLFVVAVVLLPFNGVLFGGSWTHIFKKAFESTFSVFSYLPSFTDGDSSPTIAVPSTTLFVSAPRQEARPVAIFWQLPKSRLEPARKLDYMLAVLCAHGDTCVQGSSEGHTAPTGGLCVFNLHQNREESIS